MVTLCTAPGFLFPSALLYRFSLLSLTTILGDVFTSIFRHRVEVAEWKVRRS